MSNKWQIEKSWKVHLGEELEKDYLIKLKSFLHHEKEIGKIIYPEELNVFEAFKRTSFEDVKVVIIGQDPYHGENQAHGLSFSVKPGVRIPPSLNNIFKEIKNDLGHEPPNHGHLIHWAKQGVLLLNSVLTVEASKAGSHQKKGWEKFTDKVIEVLNDDKENIVFILWGSPAQKKGERIDERKHLVLKSVHPSPLSAHRGFYGNHHFSKANKYLISHGKGPIDWSIPRQN